MYADKQLDRNLFGWEFPASWVQSINPVFIIIFAGVFADAWHGLGPRQPSSPIKFACGTGIMGLAFLAFIPFAGGGPNSTPLLALVGILLLFTFAELFLSPIGLSLATKLAPRGIPHADGGAVLPLGRAGHRDGRHPRRLLQPEDEVPYFLWIGGASIATAVVMVILTPWIRKMMAGVH